jgi:hypothetical protein
LMNWRLLRTYNNKMQNLRKLNIFQLYKRLPFIIYKSKYLIPQRPNSLDQADSPIKSVERLMISKRISEFTIKKLK